MIEVEECFICGCKEINIESLQPEGSESSFWCGEFLSKISCPVCGIYKVNQYYFPNVDEIIKAVEQRSKKSYTENERNEKKALLKYCVKLSANKDSYSYDSNNIFYITIEWCENIFNTSFPTPAEQINHLIIFLGNMLRYPGKKYDCFREPISMLNLISATASIDEQNLLKVCEYAQELSLIERNESYNSLTVKGWQEYEKLKKGRSDSKFIFMAMQFDDEQMKFIEDSVKSVVKKLKFELCKLPDIYMQENTIDLKLRNAIRDSRLVICDLTHRNNGAYFEAGFAEGLGKPVIYICEQNTFDDKNKKIHFDVEHQEIYRWKSKDKGSIEKFQQDLEAKIRAVVVNG
ncbi:MAG: hypothetical protein LBN01_00165 [Endomicrobium sp.]|jgi:nucleoside 2-deoxyribosyltransferase|nr:hypothetical protein [Endomicrobium sp.]